MTELETAQEEEASARQILDDASDVANDAWDEYSRKASLEDLARREWRDARRKLKRLMEEKV